MSGDGAPEAAIQAFAEQHGLSFSATPELPQAGAMLSVATRSVGSGASGKLPGGIDGTVCDYSFTVTVSDADNHSHTETRIYTLVVTQVPESVGFLPYAIFAGRSGQMPSSGDDPTKQLDLGEEGALKHGSMRVFEGSNEEWLTELFSPSLTEWLARSADDFGFELAGGTLVVARHNYLSGTDLESLCSDAAHLAGALRKESVEEIDSGGAKLTAAKSGRNVLKAEQIVATTKLSSPPDDAGAAAREFRRNAWSSPRIIGAAMLNAFGGLVILNVFIIPLTIPLGHSPPRLVGFEVVVWLIFTLLFLRVMTRDTAIACAELAFVESYARSRKLKVEDRLQFAATHAEAKIPFEPDYVLSGTLPGGTSGAIAWHGDGDKRSDQIAVVAGERGPIASAELQSGQPGLSSADLDGYAERLGKQLD